MNWFWHTLWICLVVIPVSILWIVCMVDIIFNRNDLVWWKRLGWLLVVLIPFVGAIAYAAVSPLFRHPQPAIYGEDLTGDRGSLVARPREFIG